MNKGHHILPIKMCRAIFALLLTFTVITVAAAFVDLGSINFLLAMLIATVKASFVVFYFMGLKFDSNENRVIFFSSFIFVAIFVVFIYSDYLFRKKELKVKPNEIVNSKQYKEKIEAKIEAERKAKLEAEHK